MKSTRVRKTEIEPTFGAPDPWLCAVIVALIAFGVVMVYSASAVYASNKLGDGYHYLWRQVTFACVACGVLFVGAKIDYRWIRRLTYPILAVVLLLLLTVIAGFGHQAGGASRWLRLGPVNIQPAELAKLAVILWLAHSLAKKAGRMRSFEIGFLPHVLVAGALMLLCLAQPDFGSAVMIGLLAFVMLFAAGARTGYLIGSVALALPAAYFLVSLFPYRKQRLLTFLEILLEPLRHRQDEGYQVMESLIAFGSGGATGVGLGDAKQKLLFLPEAHTDFIGAIIGEELGFVGVVLICFAFSVVVVRGLRLAWHATDDYAAYLAVGTATFIGVQAFTNLAVALALLPTKGLALPFLSYGGSSLLANAGAAAVLLSISRARFSAEAETPVVKTTKTARVKPAPRFQWVRLSRAGGAK